jgi:hypothetical protein
MNYGISSEQRRREENDEGMLESEYADVLSDQLKERHSSSYAYDHNQMKALCQAESHDTVQEFADATERRSTRAHGENGSSRHGQREPRVQKLDEGITSCHHNHVAYGAYSNGSPWVVSPQYVVAQPGMPHTPEHVVWTQPDPRVLDEVKGKNREIQDLKDTVDEKEREIKQLRVNVDRLQRAGLLAVDRFKPAIDSEIRDGFRHIQQQHVTKLARFLAKLESGLSAEDWIAAMIEESWTNLDVKDANWASDKIGVQLWTGILWRFFHENLFSKPFLCFGGQQCQNLDDIYRTIFSEHPGKSNVVCLFRSNTYL